MYILSVTSRTKSGLYNFGSIMLKFGFVNLDYSSFQVHYPKYGFASAPAMVFEDNVFMKLHVFTSSNLVITVN